MSYAELSGWVSYMSIEPTLAERIDIGFAQLMALQANINRDSKKRPEPFTAADFMPYWTKKADPAASDPDDDDGMAPERVMKVMEQAMRAQEEDAKKRMAPERVMKVMENAMRAQEVERVARAARQRMAERKRGRDMQRGV